ncbi:MAG: response regulator [Deltaproteobacteria bacterium]|jgi:signal transduction histidine kinase|nr:response regulator [Deltaproteobacteria bacterium]
MPEKILVIDDERMILDLTSMVLTNKGYSVLTINNALEGYQIIERHKPSLVLLDYMMPVVNGLEALKEIRKRFPETYVIMFTGKGSEEVAVELMKAGAADYILKPFSNTNLIERIENVLRLRSIELRNRELLEERERLLAEIEQWNHELERRVEEKSKELERAHVEILQAEKLAALGHLSAGMAHEVRNPLNSIGLFAQILRSGVDNDPEMVSYSEKIIHEVERIDSILVKLLSTSKRAPFELRSTHIEDVIEKALRPFEDVCQAQKIDVIRDFTNRSPEILADAEELGQVFSNLFANAIFEMDNGGRLAVALKHNPSELEVIVSDTGQGIPQDHLGKIFDPFFTTKDKGTGFGLSVVLRIVKNYGGRISVESEVGRGTSFHILLPIH